jgi:hypothetical protein
VKSRDCRRCLATRGGLDDFAQHASAELALRGRFEETYEWRISTYTTRQIERVKAGYFVRCATDGAFEALMTREEDALAAYVLFSDLQHSLFYAIGWASWTSKTQLEEDDPLLEEDDPPRAWSLSLRSPCERYVSGLWTDGRERARAIAVEARVAIDRGEPWENDNASLRGIPEPYASGDAGESKQWVEARVERDGLKFISASPNVGRAAEFLLVYEGIANDLQRERGW